ncbi:MAG: Ldh family oxidoreductase [Verrucomicrobia bacterium]|nr:Ldh family oxidoreductase [Verrucomicrobiota bacterium]
MNVSADLLSRQTAAILSAWGLPKEQVEATTHVLVSANLRGIDSHGVSMLTLYDEHRRGGKLTLKPEVKVVRESPVTALIDGDGGLGHFPGLKAMDLAIEKCARAGLAAVAVRNSNHYGAAGAYALRAADRGFIGISTTATWRPGIVPTFGAKAMLGTNPIAFAAPAKRNPPFCLDMATSTVSLNKIKLAALHGETIPSGWALDAQGRPVTDARQAVQTVLLAPLGGSPEMSSYKGYGLAMMVEILSTTLSGSCFAATREEKHPNAERHNVGHFCLALDPKAFRGEGEFENDLDDMLDALRATPRANTDEAVQVAGDPEQACFLQRSRDGIPISPEMAKTLRRIADGCGAKWLLAGA